MQHTDVLDRIRDRLDEPTPAHWSNRQLRRWLNDALNDVSRITRHIKGFTTIPSVAGTSEYTIAGNVIEIEAAWWVVDATQVIPLTPVHYDRVDNVWGRWQNTQSGEPSMFTTYGAAPFLTVKLYPTPDTSTPTLRLYVAREARNIDPDGNDDTLTPEFPNAWLDMLVDYVEYCALRNDRDPRWQEAFNLYLSKRDDLANQTYLDVAREIVFDPMVGGLPGWLVSGW